MANWQFYALFITSVSSMVTALGGLTFVGLAIVTNNKRLDDMKSDTNSRINGTHTRIDELKSDTNMRFDKVDARFDKIEAKLDRLLVLSERVAAVEVRVAHLEQPR